MVYTKEVDYFEDLSLVVPFCYAPVRKERQTDIVTAAAFPPDCSYSQHYNISYNVNFLKALFAACERFKNLRILLKAKDPENIDVYRENPEIDRLFNDYCDQIILVKKKRGDVWDVIESADMVIGVGFTTPALQAALGGYKVLIYEELKYYNTFLDSMDMQITSSVDEFCDKCGEIIQELLPQNPSNNDTQLSNQP